MLSLNGVWRTEHGLSRHRNDAARQRAADGRLRPPFKRALLFEALEQRVLLSADLIPAADDFPESAPAAAPLVQSDAPQLFTLDMGTALAQSAPRPEDLLDPVVFQSQPFTAGAGTLISIEPYDPALGRLDVVQVSIQGVLSIIGSAQTVGSYQVEVTQDFAGVNAGVDDRLFEFGAPARLIYNGVALAPDEPFAVSTPFTYTFTFDAGTDAVGYAVGTLSSDWVSVPPPTIFGRRADFVESEQPADQITLVQSPTAIGAVAVASSSGTLSLDYHYTLALPWQEQGPGIIATDGFGALAQLPASGAIQSIAVHPYNPDVVFVGAVNGGIWRSTDANAASPQWEPLTDTARSLAIGDVAISPIDRMGAPLTGATPLDRLVVYAGTGSFSSTGGLGGRASGVLKTLDGGSTWAQTGRGELVGHRVTSVVPTSEVTASGQVVLAATDGGIFRSVNGGDSWQLLSGDGASGLPAAAASDLIAVPRSGSAATDLYAGVPGHGIYRSENGGATWALIGTGVTEIDDIRRIRLAVHASTGTVYAGFIGRADTRLSSGTAVEVDTISVDDVTGFQTGDHIQIGPLTTLRAPVAEGEVVIQVEDASAFEGVDVIGIDFGLGGVVAGPYEVALVSVVDRTITLAAPLPRPFAENALVVDKSFENAEIVEVRAGTLVLREGLTQPHAQGEPVVVSSGRLAALLRTAGGTDPVWISLPLPTTTVNGRTFGIHPEGSGESFFSMVVDPADPDVIYLGGQRQPGESGPSVARLFRGDFGALPGQEWEEIVGPGANDTSPHADSRDMVFAVDLGTGARWILEASDGGLYRLDNPSDPTGRLWDFVGGGIRAAEIYSIAYDPLNDVILAGTQDNGAIRLPAEAADGLDNDNDGLVDEPDERFGWLGVTLGDAYDQGVAVVPANRDGIDNDGNGSLDDAGEIGSTVLRFTMNNGEFLWHAVDAGGNPLTSLVPPMRGVPARGIPETLRGVLPRSPVPLRQQRCRAVADGSGSGGALRERKPRHDDHAHPARLRCPTDQRPRLRRLAGRGAEPGRRLHGPGQPRVRSHHRRRGIQRDDHRRVGSDQGHRTGPCRLADRLRGG